MYLWHMDKPQCQDGQSKASENLPIDHEKTSEVRIDILRMYSLTLLS